jgi:hypothetical protein
VPRPADGREAGTVTLVGNPEADVAKQIVGEVGPLRRRRSSAVVVFSVAASRNGSRFFSLLAGERQGILLLNLETTRLTSVACFETEIHKIQQIARTVVVSIMWKLEKVSANEVSAINRE